MVASFVGSQWMLRRFGLRSERRFKKHTMRWSSQG